MAENEYTTMQSIPLSGGILHCGPPSFWLICGNERWLTEWHHYCGPTVLDRRTESPKSNQPGERSMFWKVATWWKNQGAVVINGVGQWQYPPREKLRYRRLGRTCVHVGPDETGPDIIEEWGDYVDNWTGPNP